MANKQQQTEITTRHVNVYYGAKQALFDVNLAFPKYQLTALIGPSGCGKSTFLRCLNRGNDLLGHTRVSGEFQFEGRDIYDQAVNVMQLRSQVGMVYQQPTPFPFSIFDNVSFSQRMSGEKNPHKLAAIVEKSLRQAAIWDEVKDNLQQSALALSGGQQQRVCLASVLAANPKVILLDEPTSALDPVATAKVEETLQQLKANYTIIMVTHNMQQASRISDQVAFFLDGKLIEFNATKKIFLHPQEQMTSDYLNGKFG
ncbi:MAG: phosphate ABC transporter ATP-binding protein PstB [Lactobacillus sp.]|nr:phosphate ABC transporter ATP-binding protein PstB [Lactobacillus sp.]MDN6052585.1 phosphate ABC transporter ATP-binding protein PstB [Lactobacillus sp.]